MTPGGDGIHSGYSKEVLCTPIGLVVYLQCVYTDFGLFRSVGRVLWDRERLCSSTPEVWR